MALNKNQNLSLRFQRGITIIEVLLVVSLISILASLLVPVYQSFQITRQLDSKSNEILSSLREAQNKAMGSEGDGRWGVYFVSGAGGDFIIYKGDSYAARDPDYDITNDVPETLTLTYSLGGAAEVNFEKLRGTPDAVGSVTMTSATGESMTININEVGKMELP